VPATTPLALETCSSHRRRDFGWLLVGDWSGCRYDQTDDKADAEGDHKAGNPRPP
jgi:hypothetical protein